MTPLDRILRLVARLVNTEPVVLVATGYALLTLVGIQVTDADVANVTRILVVVLPLVGATVARSAVTPTGRAADHEQQAIADTLSALADGDLDPYVHLPGLAPAGGQFRPNESPYRGGEVEELPADDRQLCRQAGGDPDCYFPAGHDSVCEPYITRPGGAS